VLETSRPENIRDHGNHGHPVASSIPLLSDSPAGFHPKEQDGLEAPAIPAGVLQGQKFPHRQEGLNPTMSTLGTGSFWEQQPGSLIRRKARLDLGPQGSAFEGAAAGQGRDYGDRGGEPDKKTFVILEDIGGVPLDGS
jgi:hypothetical protein